MGPKSKKPAGKGKQSGDGEPQSPQPLQVNFYTGPLPAQYSSYQGQQQAHAGLPQPYSGQPQYVPGLMHPPRRGYDPAPQPAPVFHPPNHAGRIQYHAPVRPQPIMPIHQHPQQGPPPWMGPFHPHPQQGTPGPPSYQPRPSGRGEIHMPESGNTDKGNYSKRQPRASSASRNPRKSGANAVAPPPSYDDVMKSNTPNKKGAANQQRGSANIEAIDKKFRALDMKSGSRPDSPSSVSSSQRGGGGRGQGRGRGATRGYESYRGGRGGSSTRGDVKRSQSFFNKRGRGGRGGRGAPRGRGHTPHKGGDTSDSVSHVSKSSAAMTTDDLDDLDEGFAIEQQRQFISELDLVKLETDACTVLVEIMSLDFDYDPLALKYFLEHCTGSKNKVRKMVVSTDLKYIIVTFVGEIDIEDLELFVVEPNNQFVNVDLDFYEVNYPSAVIAFTDKTWSEVESILQTARSHITDSISEYRISDDTGYQYVMIAFNEEISDQYVQRLVENKLCKELNIQPLYPYPDNQEEYMNVNEESYKYVYEETDLLRDTSDDIQSSVLLTQSSSSLSANLLKKIMCLDKYSGGDSSGKLVDISLPYDDMRVIRYNKPNTCINVLSKSPITYSRNEDTPGDLVGHVCLSVDVPTDESYDSTSLYFLILTNVGGLRKDVLKYYCAAAGKQTVNEVYFSQDEEIAVVMFSCEPSAKRPDYKNISQSDDPLPPALQELSIWRPTRVTEVRLSGFSNSADVQDIKSQITTWVEDNNIAALCDVKGKKKKQTITISFKSERDLIKFLCRNQSSHTKLVLDETCLEMPVLPCLGDCLLFTERVVAPSSLSIRYIINEAFSSNTEDYSKYIQFHGKADLNEKLKDCMAFISKAGSHIAPLTQQSPHPNTDIVKIYSNWKSAVTTVVTDFLIDLCMMKERSVSRTQWETKLKKSVPKSLYVVWEAEGSQNTKLRAYGIYADVRRFEEFIDSADRESNALSKQVQMPISQANFINIKKIEDLRTEYPNTRINMGLGTDFGTLTVKGSSSDVDKVLSDVEEIRKTLTERRLTTDKARYLFMREKLSGEDALRYLNKNILADYNATFRYVHDDSKGFFFILTTTSEEKGSLNEAEKKFRETIIVESFELATNKIRGKVLEGDWKIIRPVIIEQIKRKQQLPIYIIDPVGSACKVQIVTVVEARERLLEILEEAKAQSRRDSSEDEGSISAASETGTKPKRARKKSKKKTKGDAVVALMDVDVGSHQGYAGSLQRNDSEGSGDSRREAKPRKPRHRNRKDSTDSEDSTGHTQSREFRPVIADGKQVFSETIYLNMSHQYIEFQFATRFMTELLTPAFAHFDANNQVSINKKTKTIKLTSSDQSEVKNAKKAILASLRQLHNETRVIKTERKLFAAKPILTAMFHVSKLVLKPFKDSQVYEQVDRTVFDRASKDLKLQFLLLKSVQCSEQDIGRVEVIRCQPSIQCIEADAMIIAVKSDLHMNQSGVGSSLQEIDPKAGEELKRHGTELPGSCFELPSHSSVTLFDRYIVLVVDTGDKGSLERAFTEALESADRMRLRSAVCNLIGADMQKFVSDRESAGIILRCLNEHCMNGKTSLTKLFICETNNHKLAALSDQLKTYGPGIEYEANRRPDIGRKMITACSTSEYDLAMFFAKSEDILD